jgi:hypothetical protein
MIIFRNSNLPKILKINWKIWIPCQLNFPPELIKAKLNRQSKTADKTILTNFD